MILRQVEIFMPLLLSQSMLSFGLYEKKNEIIRSYTCFLAMQASYSVWHVSCRHYYYWVPVRNLSLLLHFLITPFSLFAFFIAFNTHVLNTPFTPENQIPKFLYSFCSFISKHPFLHDKIFHGFGVQVSSRHPAVLNQYMEFLTDYMIR